MPPPDPLALVPSSSVALSDPRIEAHQQVFADVNGSGLAPALDSRERLPPTAFYDPRTGCYVVGRGGGGGGMRHPMMHHPMHHPMQPDQPEMDQQPSPPVDQTAAIQAAVRSALAEALPPTHRAGYFPAPPRTFVGRGGGGGGGHGGGGGGRGGGGFGGGGFGGGGFGGHGGFGGRGGYGGYGGWGGGGWGGWGWPYGGWPYGGWGGYWPYWGWGWPWGW